MRRLAALLLALAVLTLSACGITEAAARDRLLEWATNQPSLSDVEATPMSGPGGSRGILLQASVADAEEARAAMDSYESYIDENPDDFQAWDARLTWAVEGGTTVAQLTPGEDISTQLEWGSRPLREGVDVRRIGFSEFSLGSGGSPGALGVELQTEEPIDVALSIDAMDAPNVAVGIDQDHWLAADNVDALHDLATTLQDTLDQHPDALYQGTELKLATNAEAITAAGEQAEETPWKLNGPTVTIDPGPGVDEYLPVAEKWEETARRIVVSETEFELWMRAEDECNSFLDDLPSGSLPLRFDCLDENHRMRLIGTAEELREWRRGVENVLAADVGSIQYSDAAVRVYQRSKDWGNAVAAIRALGWTGTKEVELSTETASVIFAATADGPAEDPNHLGEPIEEDSDEAKMVATWDESAR